MSRYRYKALAPDGEVVLGHLAADSRQDAIAKLRQRGVVPLEAEAEARRKGAPRSQFLPRFEPKRIDRREVLAFTRELATLLHARIPLDRAVDKLAEPRAGGPFGRVLRSVSSNVKSGDTLATALRKSGSVFPPFYTGLVQAGEAAGTLPSVLDDLAKVITESQELRDKVLGSLTYPLIVLALIAVSFVILMAWVVPEFRPLLEREDADIPFTASVVLFLSGLVVDWGWLIAVLLAAFAVFALRLYRAGRLQAHIDRLALKIPRMGRHRSPVGSGQVLSISGHPAVERHPAVGRGRYCAPDRIEHARRAASGVRAIRLGAGEQPGGCT